MLISSFFPQLDKDYFALPYTRSKHGRQMISTPKFSSAVFLKFLFPSDFTSCCLWKDSQQSNLLLHLHIVYFFFVFKSNSFLLILQYVLKWIGRNNNTELFAKCLWSCQYYDLFVQNQNLLFHFKLVLPSARQSQTQLLHKDGGVKWHH